MKSKLIAISAISAGFIAILLTLGAYIEMVDLFAIVVASVFTMLPLYYKSYKSAILAFLVGGVIAFLFSGFNFLSVVFPAYFCFFGIYPIIKCLMQEKNMNKIVAKVIGLVWCVLAIFGVYFFYTLVMHEALYGLSELLVKYIYVVVGVIAVVFYFVYDYSIAVFRRIIDKYLYRFLK